MVKDNSWKIRTQTSGGFGNSDAAGQGKRGWFEDPRFWRKSFVYGPLANYTAWTIFFQM